MDELTRRRLVTDCVSFYAAAAKGILFTNDADVDDVPPMMPFASHRQALENKHLRALQNEDPGALRRVFEETQVLNQEIQTVQAAFALFLIGKLAGSSEAAEQLLAEGVDLAIEFSRDAAESGGYQ